MNRTAGIRLGSFVLIRDAIDEELEQVFSGKRTAQAASTSPPSAATVCCGSSAGEPGQVGRVRSRSSVIASEAKQSIARHNGRMDCFRLR